MSIRLKEGPQNRRIERLVSHSIAYKQVFFRGKSPNEVAIAIGSASVGAGAKLALGRSLMVALGITDFDSIHLSRSQLGKPLLVLDDDRHLGFSCSYLGERIWVAVADSNIPLGVDAAGSNEFMNNYPFEHAFSTSECERIKSDANHTSYAARLWSIKESLVKAMGTGFHFLNPSEIDIDPECSSVHLELRKSHSEGLKILNFQVSSWSIPEGWVSLAGANLQ